MIGDQLTNLEAAPFTQMQQIPISDGQILVILIVNTQSKTIVFLTDEEY